MQVPTKCTTRENGLGYLDTVGPNACLRAHQAGENTAAPKCPAARAGQRYLREERGFGDADFGVRGNQHLLGFANVGTPLEQRGGQSGGHFRRKRLFCERASTRYALRILAYENADGIFFLSNLSLKVG